MRNEKQTIRKMARLLHDASNGGGYYLPNIQRSFVWQEDRIERLFDSIMREYPIGTLLIWKTKDEIRHRPFVQHYTRAYRPSSNYVPDNNKLKHLVLDGQQRLQSLLIGLFGSYDGKKLYFDVLSGQAQHPDDIKFRFRFLDPKHAAPPWFCLSDIVGEENANSFRVARNLINQFPPNKLTDENEETIQTNSAQALKVFGSDEAIAYQLLDSLDQPDLYRSEDVVEVFIRANSGGTPLGRSDLLFSLLLNTWDEADKLIDELLDELNGGNQYAFTRDFIIKTCLVLLGAGAKYEVDKLRRREIVEGIPRNWQRISDAIRAVRDFLEEMTLIRSDKALTSYLVLIPIIYFRYHHPEQWSQTKGRVTEYLTISLLSSVFNQTPDTLIDVCIARIKADATFNHEQLFQALKDKGLNLALSPERLLSSGYQSQLIHVLFSIWYRDFNYSPVASFGKPQIDHIFPQSLLRTAKKKNENNRQVLRYRDEDRNQLANCMLLEANENQTKSDTPPNEWLKDKPAEYLQKHLIPDDPNLWTLENYDQFIEERKKLILNKFQHLLTSSAS